MIAFRTGSLLLCLTALAAVDWPQMGGPRGSHSADDPSLAEDWTGAEAQVAWRVKLTGTGGPGQVAARAGLVYVVDQNPKGTEAILRVLALADGQEHWRASWATPPPPGKTGVSTQSKRPFGMAAVAEDMAYVIGLGGTVRGFDLAARQQTWVVADPVTALGGAVNGCASPIVVGDLLCMSAKVGTGKPEQLLALDRRSGALRWACKLPFIDGFVTSLQNAPQAVTWHGVQQVVVHHASGVSGVSMAGDVLWNWTGYQRGTLTATPTVTPDGYVYVSSGHEGSCGMCRVVREGGTWTATTVFADGEKLKGQALNPDGSKAGYPPPHLIFGNWNIASAAWWDGHFYAVGCKGLHCLRADGSIAWTANHPEANVSAIAVNGRVITFASNAQGTLLFARASPAGFQELARCKIRSRTSNTQIAYADGRLLSRSATDQELVCVDLGARREVARQ